MKLVNLFFLLGLLAGPGTIAATVSSSASFYDLSVKDAKGQLVSLKKYQGKVLLIVNTASQCGFTPQLKDLEDLYKAYRNKGLVILAFPSNDFKQDPTDVTTFTQAAQKDYGVSFPIFDKISVKGPDRHPLYQFLTEQKKSVLLNEISWNFEKFLINRQGEVVDRWKAPNFSKQKMQEAIEKLL